MASHDDMAPAKPKSEDNQRTHQCKKCSLSFETGQQLGGHMRKHYPGILNPKRKNPQLDLNLGRQQQQQQEEANSNQQKQENVNLKHNQHEVNSSRRFELDGLTISLNRQLPDWIKEEILRREEKEKEKEKKDEKKEKEDDEKNEGIFFQLLPSGNNKNREIKLHNFFD